MLNLTFFFILVIKVEILDCIMFYDNVVCGCK